MDSVMPALHSAEQKNRVLFVFLWATFCTDIVSSD